MSEKEALIGALKGFQTIYEGCCGVIEEEGIEDSTKVLAKLIRKDCNKFMSEIQSVLVEVKQ